MTECNQEVFSLQHIFRAGGGPVHGWTSDHDGGALLLRQADRKINLLARLAAASLTAARRR